MTRGWSSLPLWAALALGCADKGGDSASGGGADGTDGADGTSAVDADGDGVSEADGDCDDADAGVFPGAPERCNGLDDDCDGAPHPMEGDDGAACLACDESGWWPDASANLTGDDLAAALHTSIRSGTICDDYDGARDRLFALSSDADGAVECVYTGRSFSISAGVDYDVVNTEHAWPRADGADGDPPECDLHHLFVTDARANTRRGNHPFGDVVDDEWSDGGSELGDDAGGATVFSPRPSARGDIARAMLYFTVAYGPDLDAGDLSRHDQPALYSRWHDADPPDPAEQANSAARADAQGGRANPFVACPWLVAELTGDGG